MNSAKIVEYVWIGGNNKLRSKTKVIYDEIYSIENIPDWNFDGSSTNQASGLDSEIIIKPKALFYDPFRNINAYNAYIVLCDTYKPNGVKLDNNHRVWALNIFNQKLEEQPWYGLEQEYFLISKNTNKPIGFDENNSQGQYYCGIGAENAFGRFIAEEHLFMCLRAGVSFLLY